MTRVLSPIVRKLMVAGRSVVAGDDFLGFGVTFGLGKQGWMGKLAL